MFNDQSLKNALKKYYAAQGITITDSAAEAAVVDVRSKLKHNTPDELKLALSEVKQSIEQKDSIAADASKRFLRIASRAEFISRQVEKLVRVAEEQIDAKSTPAANIPTGTNVAAPDDKKTPKKDTGEFSWAIEGKKPSKSDPRVVQSVIEQLKKLKSELVAQSDMGSKILLAKKKEAQDKLKHIEQEIKQLSNYDPIKQSKTGEMQQLLADKELREATDTEANIFLSDAIRTKGNPEAYKQEHDKVITGPLKAKIEKAFGPITWDKYIAEKSGEQIPFLKWNRKRINYELLKGKPLPTETFNAYTIDLGTLLGARRVITKYLLELEGYLEAVFNVSKHQKRIEFLEPFEEEYGLKELGWQVKTRKALEVFQKQIKDDAEIIAKVGRQVPVLSDKFSKELQDMIKKQEAENKDISSRWSEQFADIATKTQSGRGVIIEPTLFNEALAFGPNMFKAFVSDRKENLGRQFIQETKIGPNDWTIPEELKRIPAGSKFSDIYESKDEADLLRSVNGYTWKMGRKIYSTLSPPTGDTDTLFRYAIEPKRLRKKLRREFVRTPFETPQQKEMREKREEALMYNNPVSLHEETRAQLAWTPNLNWKIYFGLAHENYQAPVGSEEQLTKSRLKVNPDDIRFALVNQDYVPDWILMYMMQTDENNLIRSVIKRRLRSRGWELVTTKNEQGKTVPLTSSGDWVWTQTPTFEKNKKRLEKEREVISWWKYYFNKYAANATDSTSTGTQSTSTSDYLARVKQQQQFDLQSKTEAQKALEREKKERAQQQELWRKQVGEKQQPSSGKEQVKLEDTTHAVPGARPPKLAPAYSSISRRDFKKKILSIREAEQQLQTHPEYKGRPHVFVQAGADNAVNKAVDELLRLRPGVLDKVTDIIIDNTETSFGSYKSNYPDVIFINFDKIKNGVKQMLSGADEKSLEKELMSQLMQTILHEATHQKVYQSTGSTSESVPDTEEKNLRDTLKQFYYNKSSNANENIRKSQLTQHEIDENDLQTMKTSIDPKELQMLYRKYRDNLKAQEILVQNASTPNDIIDQLSNSTSVFVRTEAAKAKNSPEYRMKADAENI